MSRGDNQADLEDRQNYPTLIGAALDSANDAIKIADLDGRSVYHNKAFIELFGYAAGELNELGGAAALFADPAKGGEIIASLLSRGSWIGEVVMRTRGGRELPIALRAETIKDSQGSSLGLIFVCTDITESDRAEQPPLEREARFHAIIRDLQVGVLVEGPRAEVLMSNRAAVDMLGLSEDQLIGKTCFDPDWGVTYEDGSPFPGEYRPVPRAIATGQPVRGVVMGVFRPRTADKVWLLVDAQPQFGADGRISQVICSFSDITDRKRSEDELRRSEERFFKAFDANPDPMTICRFEDGHFLHVNESFVRATGYNRQEVIGRSPIHIGLWADPADGRRLTALLDARGRIYKQKVQFRMKGGALCMGLLSVEIIDVGGERCLLAVASDVTETEQRDEQSRAQAVQSRQEVEARRRGLAEKYGFKSIIGTSPAMLDMRKLMRKVANDESVSVLLKGESGTGKEMVARAIHYESRRAMHPFVAVNCAALPRELIESELFGHERGAFTGATSTRKGLFEQADGGTLFLDEIGDLDPSLQVKLLRALQERKVRRLGGSKDIGVDVRVIAASNLDLKNEVAAGRFREDLFYRLAVIEISIPPLRERGDEDLRLLVDHFVTKMSLERGLPIRSFDPKVFDLMSRYHWPGNVRELQNVIEHMIVVAEGDRLSTESLPPDFARQAARPAERRDLPLRAGRVSLGEDDVRTLLETLDRNRGVKARAAKELGLTRGQLDYRLKIIEGLSRK
jgi:PAS domain S-box-containing protein